MNNCIICGKECAGQCCSGACRAKASRARKKAHAPNKDRAHAIDSTIDRAPTNEALCEPFNNQADVDLVDVYEINPSAPLSEPYINGYTMTEYDDMGVDMSMCCRKSIGQMQVPGDREYNGCCRQHNGQWHSPKDYEALNAH